MALCGFLTNKYSDFVFPLKNNYFIVYYKLFRLIQTW